MKNYKVIEEYGRFTIGEFDKEQDAWITNDGICQYYYWPTREDAQKAADAYNTYDGPEWLAEHTAGNDSLEYGVDQYDEKMLELYKLFNAVEYPD